MSADIRSMSETLAADPSSTVFLRLGEALRASGQVELAWRVATRGLERHAQRPDAHDLRARVAVDRGDFDTARAEWDTVLTLAPGHGGALKGLGFLCFRHGDLDAAARFLASALAGDPTDSSLATALHTVRAARDASAGASAPPTSPLDAVPDAAPGSVPDARALFRAVLGDARQSAILLDANGYVVAGEYLDADGRECGADIGAQLSGVSEAADRAMRHLGLGRWQQIVFEADATSVAMAPSGDGILLVAAPRAVPLGLVRRLLERSLVAARRWSGVSA